MIGLGIKRTGSSHCRQYILTYYESILSIFVALVFISRASVKTALKSLTEYTTAGKSLYNLKKKQNKHSSKQSQDKRQHPTQS